MEHEIMGVVDWAEFNTISLAAILAGLAGYGVWRLRARANKKEIYAIHYNFRNQSGDFALRGYLNGIKNEIQSSSLGFYEANLTRSQARHVKSLEGVTEVARAETAKTNQ